MIVIPVVLGVVFLGGAFDMFDVKPTRFSIFDREDVQNNIQVSELHTERSEYKIVTSPLEAADFLDIDTAVALKVMNGNIGLQGLGNYFTRLVQKQNYVEVLLSKKIETVVEHFGPDTKIDTLWQSRPHSEVGTHFVQSITYGGQLVVSVVFQPNKPEDLQDIKSEIENRLGSAGAVAGNVFEQLRKIEKHLQDKTSVVISVYTTSGVVTPPTSIKDIEQLWQEYPGTLVNEGKGTPLSIELQQIHDIKSAFPEFKVKRALYLVLDNIVEYYHDVSSARVAFRKWYNEVVDELKPEEEQWVNTFNKNSINAARALSKAINKLDLTADESQFDEAIRAYNRGEEYTTTYKYNRELRRLIKRVEEQTYFRSVYSMLLSIQEQSQ